MQVTPQVQRAALVERLRARSGEVEEAIRERVYALSGTEKADSSYAEGLRAAVGAALSYGLAALEASDEHPPAVPIELLAQARLAARNGVGVDTVLRRYFGGYVLLGEFLAQEAAGAEMSAATLKGLIHTQAVAFDRLLAAVSEEHARESRPLPVSTERHRMRLVQRLLAGELLDPSGIVYDFEGHHIGLVAGDRGATEPIRELATALDARLLLVHRDETTVWAWFGARRPLDPAEVERAVSASRDYPPSTLALGEPVSGLAGWRLTHRQAAAALSVAQRGPDPVVRYRDVALLASILQDDLLVTSLRRLYLEPLEGQRDGGEVARETLRAYFAADRNASSAAAALGVNRNTISERLRTIESAIGRPLSSCGPELETALRLAEPDTAVSPEQDL